MQIKVKKQTIEIKPGDYILDNGAVKMLCSGNGRFLVCKGFDRYTHIKLPKTLAAKLMKGLKPVQDGNCKKYLIDFSKNMSQIYRHPAQNGIRVLELVEPGKGNTTFKEVSTSILLVSLQNPLIARVFQREDKTVIVERKDGTQKRIAV